MTGFIRVTFLILGLIAVTGCGETMKSNQVAATSNTQTYRQGNYYNEYGQRVSDTSQTVDEQAYTMYRSEVMNTPAQTALAQSIQAYDLILELKSNNQVEMRSRITLSCGSVIDFTQSFSAQVASGGGEMDLGVRSNHRVRVRCADNQCSSVVAVISNSQAGLLTGMAANAKQGNKVLYVNRHVNFLSYFPFRTGSAFNSETSCTQTLLSEQNLSLGDQIINGVLEDVGSRVIEEVQDFLSDLF